MLYCTVVGRKKVWPVPEEEASFPVVGRCRTQLWALFELVMVENPRFAVGISTLSIVVP